MTATSHTWAASVHWCSFVTGVAPFYSGHGTDTPPGFDRSVGWYLDPDEQEIGEFCIWPVRDLARLLVTVEVGEVVKREGARTVYDGRFLVPDRWHWALSDNAGWVEPLRRLSVPETGWYRLVAQVANREAAAAKEDRLLAAWDERTRGMSYEEMQAIPDEDTPDAELRAEPLEHWYLTVAERIGDLPDYDY